MTVPTIPTTVCNAPECTNLTAPWDDYCEAHSDAVGDTCGWSQWGGFDNPPEHCDEDAIPGTDRCSAHTDDVIGEDDEDGHDYWD